MTLLEDQSGVALVSIDEMLWEIPASSRADMRVPARVFADRELLEAIIGDQFGRRGARMGGKPNGTCSHRGCLNERPREIGTVRSDV